jgi:hypothetical protein
MDNDYLYEQIMNTAHPRYQFTPTPTLRHSPAQLIEYANIRLRESIN